MPSTLRCDSRKRLHSILVFIILTRLSTRKPPVLNSNVKMSSDFEAYEQDFGTITAEITNKIGRIPKLSGGETVKCISRSYVELQLAIT